MIQLNSDTFADMFKALETRSWSETRRSNNVHVGDCYCSRKATYNTLITDKSKTLSSELFFSQAIAVEKVLLDTLENENIVVDQQMKTSIKDLAINGYCDAIALWEKELRIIEVKSCSILPESAAYSHERQALAYSALFAIPRFDVVYMTRNLANTSSKISIRIFSQRVDIKLWDSALTRMIAAALFKEKQLSPPLHKSFPPALCGFCDYKKICWKNLEAPLLPIPSDEQRNEIFARVQDIKNSLLNNKSILTRYKNTVAAILDRTNKKELSSENVNILKAMLAGANQSLADENKIDA